MTDYGLGKLISSSAGTSEPLTFEKLQEAFNAIPERPDPAILVTKEMYYDPEFRKQAKKYWGAEFHD